MDNTTTRDRADARDAALRILRRNWLNALQSSRKGRLYETRLQALGRAQAYRVALKILLRAS